MTLKGNDAALVERWCVGIGRRVDADGGGRS